MIDTASHIVEFRNVPTWKFNGLHIGHLDQFEPFEPSDPVRSWQMDDCFQTAPQSGAFDLPELLRIIATQPDGQTITIPIAEQGVAGDDITITPEILFHEPDYDILAQPVMFTTPIDEGPIDAVITFFNEYDADSSSDYDSGSSLDTDLNLQASLEWTESYSDFETYLLFNPSVVSGYKNLEALLNAKFDDTWAIRVWVMPQVRGSEFKCLWNNFRDRLVHSFLDADLIETEAYPRALYFVVDGTKRDETSVQKKGGTTAKGRKKGGKVRA